MADGQATKIYLPSGADGLLGQLASVAELVRTEPVPAPSSASSPSDASPGNGRTTPPANPSLPPPPA